jgi:glycosyltransferase involved in cell wall biosynthesis
VDTKISVVIRSKNEELFIGKVLQQVLAQEFAAPYEVIVLDSGSQDRTLDIVRRFPVRLEAIPPERFTFGYALNEGVTLARGEYVVFLSAHCVPRDRSWLRELIHPFDANPLVAATYGRQEPLPGVNPFEERGLARAYALREGKPIRAHFSNANSAVRKYIVQRYPFDEEVANGEDFLWAYFLPPPHMIQYVHAASVFHSHPLSLRYWRQRWYSEGLFTAYLVQHHGLPDPWADSDEEPELPFKWRVFKKIGAEMRALWQKKAFSALFLYPLYGLNRVYFYKKGKKVGVRLYRRTASLSRLRLKERAENSD